ncbi:TIM barrel protein [Nakamurella deserti]|uniref:TIM barrel protein n=1 Tax=Nakamurella deserti TaxID=2164074 RepID=UPI000DBE906F|nr:TIM barrel protein [Nakamurella deserti]
MTLLPPSDGVTIGTAPDSWGVWFADDPVQVPYTQFLTEAAAAGYEWIELGPYGYLPTDPSALADALAPGNFKVTAGTVFEHLQRENSWDDVWTQVSDVAGLAKSAGAEYVVVIPSMWRDDVTGEEVEPYHLDAAAWDRKIKGNDRLGKAILEEYGMKVVYHPHADSHVDNNAAVERFLEGTDPDYVNLCLDTGHLSYCGGDNLDLIAKHPSRVTYTHLKQVDPQVKAVVDENNFTWAKAVQLGVMQEPPGGVPHMPDVFAALEGLGRPIFGIVEQDMYGCAGDVPFPIAERTLTYLKGCRHVAPRG